MTQGINNSLVKKCKNISCRLIDAAMSMEAQNDPNAVTRLFTLTPCVRPFASALALTSTQQRGSACLWKTECSVD